MKLLVRFLALAAAIQLAATPAIAQRRPRASSAVLERNVRAHLGFLASDALQGRGSATNFERIAAEYVAAQLAQFGLEPAGDEVGGVRSFLQRVPLEREVLTGPPVLRAGGVELVFGRDFVAKMIAPGTVTGPLQALGPGSMPERGAVAVVSDAAAVDEREIDRLAYRAFRAGVAALVVPERPGDRAAWESMAAEAPAPQPRKPGARARGLTWLVASREAAAALAALAPGSSVTVAVPSEPDRDAATWNVVGRLRGTDQRKTAEAILLGAHIDHLGIGVPVDGDHIYNGADDDASGVVAVLELARSLATGPRPRRTIYIACFGSEEVGGFGADYFVEHSPVPLERIVAHLQFEMIGRPDPAVPAGTLWLTGFDRSTLGPELARRGAKLVADPHPEQGFFERSDNYTLALKGVVAQTVSSFGLHEDYHQPSDELSTIDTTYMSRAIGSLVGPVRWLASSRFRPAWRPGLAPAPREQRGGQ